MSRQLGVFRFQPNEICINSQDLLYKHQISFVFESCLPTGGLAFSDSEDCRSFSAITEYFPATRDVHTLRDFP